MCYFCPFKNSMSHKMRMYCDEWLFFVKTHPKWPKDMTQVQKNGFGYNWNLTKMSSSRATVPPRSTLQECLRKIVPAQCLLFLLGWAFWEIHSISLQICKGGYPLKMNTNIMGFYSLSVKPYIQMCKLTRTWIEVLHQHVSIQKTKHGTAVQLNPV